MNQIIGINPDYDALYDPQQVRPTGFCDVCGRELYRPFQQTCDRCLFDMELEDE